VSCCPSRPARPAGFLRCLVSHSASTRQRSQVASGAVGPPGASCCSPVLLRSASGTNASHPSDSGWERQRRSQAPVQRRTSGRASTQARPWSTSVIVRRDSEPCCSTNSDLSTVVTGQTNGTDALGSPLCFAAISQRPLASRLATRSWYGDCGQLRSSLSLSDPNPLCFASPRRATTGVFESTGGTRLESRRADRLAGRRVVASYVTGGPCGARQACCVVLLTWG
jgi:hypothetical protein